MKKIFILSILFVLSFGYAYGEIIRITNNAFSDEYPMVDEQGRVWWLQTRNSVTYLMHYNGTEVVEISEYVGRNQWSYQSMRRLIDGSSAVYMKYGAVGQTEIYLFDGSKEIQITNNNYSSFDPYICNGYIVWQAQPPYNSGSGDNPNEIFLYKPEQPTAVQMSALKATPVNKAVKLQWQTESEIDNAGFNVWRAEGFKKVNQSIISAEGSPIIGADYNFFDKWVMNGKLYYYLIEDVDNNGISTFHGPVKAVPRAAYGVSR